MNHRVFIAVFAIACILLPTISGASSAAKEPLSWQLAPMKMPYAWHANRHNVAFAATIDLPNGCYRAKIQRRTPVDPKSPVVYEVWWGQIAGAMCMQMIVSCAALSVPEFITKNYVVAKDRKGSQKVRISRKTPKLPKTCPT